MSRQALAILFSIVCLFFFTLTVPAVAELIPVESRIRVSYDSVEMQTPDARTGLLGFQYLANLHPNWYAGVGGYGSVKGDHGGFFTAGLTGGVQKKLFSELWLDAGLYVGAGGGGGTSQTEGLILRPYVGLFYDFKAVQLGLEYSRFNFHKSDTSSNSAALTIDIPFTNYFANGHDEVAASDFNKLDYGTDQTPGFAQQEILLKLSTYNPTTSIYNSSGGSSDARLNLIGVQFRHFLNTNSYALAEAAGAYGGTAGGYAEFLVGGGYRFPLTPSKKFRLNLNLALGFLAAGNVDIGGGALARGEAGLEYRFSPNLFMALNGGYIDNFSGSFAATILSGEFGISFETLGSGYGFNRPPDEEKDKLSWNLWRVRASHLTYTAPENSSTGNDDRALQLIGLKIDHFLNDRFYLSGQAASAYSGNTGGYVVGLVGVGIQSDYLRGEGFRLFGELLAGAAAGGGIDVGDGAVVQPMAGLEFNFNDTISLQTMFGMIKAINGNLESPVVDISLTWSFGTLSREIH